MKLSTTTVPLRNVFSLKECIDILADAGYDAIDYSQTAKFIYEAEPDKEYYSEIKKYAEDKGLYFNQSHAPYHSSCGDEAKDKIRFEEIVKSMQKASFLGIKNIIVHPCQHLEYDIEGNPEKLFEYNMDFYGRLKPYCEEYGINVALENMWQSTGSIINHSTCSKAEEFIRYLDELNSPCFVACLDIGHAALVREDPAEFIKKLGAKRLKALHVHDVDGTHDLHTLPYYGSVNWEKTMKALKEIGYTGELTYEADGFMAKLPAELWADAEKLMCKVGRHLISKFE